MPFRITNYNCRFISDLSQPAHIIIRKERANNHTNHKSAFFSAPLYNKATSDRTNVLVAFKCDELAKQVMQSIEIGSGHEMILARYPIQAIIDYGALLNLPSVVVLSIYCELNTNISDGDDNEHYEILYSDVRMKKPTIGFNEDYKDSE